MLCGPLTAGQANLYTNQALASFPTSVNLLPRPQKLRSRLLICHVSVICPHIHPQTPADLWFVDSAFVRGTRSLHSFIVDSVCDSEFLFSLQEFCCSLVAHFS